MTKGRDSQKTDGGVLQKEKGSPDPDSRTWERKRQHNSKGKNTEKKKVNKKRKKKKRCIQHSERLLTSILH